MFDERFEFLWFTLTQHWVDVSCLPGMGMDFPAHTYPEVGTLYEHSENILFRLRHFTEIISENYLNLCQNIRIVHYSLSDGGGWSKMKVSFSVSF